MMKDTFYFSHDSNARNDERILELRAEFGWEGYGLFWALVESMREASGYRLRRQSVKAISLAMATPLATLMAIVDKCIELGLFECDEDDFWSPSLRRRMEFWDAKKAKLAEAGHRGAEARWAKAAKKKRSDGHPISHPKDDPNATAKATAMATQCDRNGNKRKENNTPLSPPRGAEEMKRPGRRNRWLATPVTAAQAPDVARELGLAPGEYPHIFRPLRGPDGKAWWLVPREFEYDLPEGYEPWQQ